MTDPVVAFSIILATYNADGSVARCLDSIWAQDYPDVELIVIDAASTDGTRAILEAHDERIAFWTSEPDDGITSAWNKGLQHVSGQWVYFIGADDVLAGPRVLTAVADLLAGLDPTFRVAYGSVRVVGADGTVHRTVGAPWAEARATFRRGMAIPHQGTFHHRSLFEIHGLFDESYKIIADYEFLLRELLEHEALFMPGLVVADMSSGGLSDDERNTTLIRELRRARYEHGLASTPPSVDVAVWRTYVRDVIARLGGPRREAQVTNAYRRVLRRPPW